MPSKRMMKTVFQNEDEAVDGSQDRKGRDGGREEKLNRACPCTHVHALQSTHLTCTIDSTHAEIPDAMDNRENNTLT